MSKALEQLSRNLASGMSRRRALWKLAAGVGVLSFLTTKKASASARNSGFVCVEFADDVYSCCEATGNTLGFGSCFGLAEQAYSLCLEHPEPVIALGGNGQSCSVEIVDNQVYFTESI